MIDGDEIFTRGPASFQYIYFSFLYFFIVIMIPYRGLPVCIYGRYIGLSSPLDKKKKKKRDPLVLTNVSSKLSSKILFIFQVILFYFFCFIDRIYLQGQLNNCESLECIYIFFLPAHNVRNCKSLSSWSWSWWWLWLLLLLLWW